MSTPRLLSRGELAGAVQRLRARYPNWDPAIATSEVLADCIRELGLFGSQTSCNSDPFRFQFFRVRSAATLLAPDCNNPPQYSYPQRQDCKSAGRAHIPGYPVFYGSDSFDGAIAEMKDASQREYYVSIWQTEEISVERLNFCYASNITAARLLKQKDTAVADMRAQHEMLDSATFDQFEALMTAWSDLFISDSWGLTAPIAYECMYANYMKRDVDVIVYGSALDGSYVNYAIHPRLADRLRLHKVLAIQTGHAAGYDVKAVADGGRASLTWRDPRAEDRPDRDPSVRATIELP